MNLEKDEDSMRTVLSCKRCAYLLKSMERVYSTIRGTSRGTTERERERLIILGSVLQMFPSVRLTIECEIVQVNLTFSLGGERRR